IVDPSPTARHDAERLGYHAFASVGEILDRRITAAVLSVPTSLHYSMALELLGAGVALLIEKPIAATLAQGQEIIEQSRHRGLPIMVGYVERFNPAVIAAQRLLIDGLVGKPLHIASRRVGGMPMRITDANVIVDIGVHDIDIISFLLQTNLKLISAQGGMALSRDRVDYASLALQAGDVVAHATINWVTPVKVRDLIITGSNGYLQVDYLRQQTHFAPGRNFVTTESYEALIAQYEEGTLLEIPIERHEPLRLELERFVAILAGTEQAPDPEISLVSLQIALEATGMIERSLQVEMAR
ncbi:MAG: Gfo/Idh/MocA family oxidoreductase, partial [Candidatus Eremiobacteraeota bacterium]|nr:Gfo/Idh/MocA family oxidoreductase [Candidatus Eremiobacteraeota bacterium]